MSAGCQNCYARNAVTRYGRDFGKRVRTSAATFNAPLRWQKEAEVCRRGYAAAVEAGQWAVDMAAAHGMVKPRKRRVFWGSWMDWLDPEVPAEWLADALDVVARCPDVIFQTVTKRPELWRDRLEAAFDVGLARIREGHLRVTAGHNMTGDWCDGKPPANVWVLASAETAQAYWDRQPALLDIPAKVKGFSIEPLLERFNLDLRHGCRGCNHPGNIVMHWNEAGRCSTCDGTGHEPSGVDWVIVGGESGPDRRDCGVDAIVNVAEECVAAGVPVFVKQASAFRAGAQGGIPGSIWARKEFPR